MNANQPTKGPMNVIKNVASKKWTFLIAFLVILFGAVSICMATGFIPDTTQSTSTVADATGTDPFSGVSTSSLLASAVSASPLVTTNTTTGASASTNGALNMNGDLPTKISIPSISVSAVIANPATTDVDSLDNYLLKGAARYPTSATLDQQGNVIIFGHSSYLPVVINQHFKTFDGIQNLKAGDQITVYSATKEYIYAVQNVQQESSTSNYAIPLTTTGHTLTLATCDSFAKKTDRFIVTSTLVGSYPLGS